MEEILKLASARAHYMDVKNEIDADLLKLAFKSGLMAVTLPKNLGGLGKGYVDLCEIVRLFGRVNSGFALTLTAHHMVVNCIKEFGTDKWMEKIAKYVGAFAITEPHAGSDISSVRLKAEEKNGFYVLNGVKTFITNGLFADLFVVLAKVEDKPTAFVVERDENVIAKKINLNGFRGCGLASIEFRCVEVPKENVLLGIGKGLRVMLSTLAKSRVVFSALGLGIAERCFELAVKRAKRRKAFGKSISDFQGIRWMIAEVKAEIEALKEYIFKTAKDVDEGKDVTLESAICKLLTAKVAKKSADLAVEIYGARGLIKHSAVERAYRDVKSLDIGEGMTEIMKEIIARAINL